MSKRARITLNLDPEPESEPPMAKKPQAEPVAKPSDKGKSAKKPAAVKTSRSRRMPRSEPEAAAAATAHRQSGPASTTRTQAEAPPGGARPQAERPAAAQRRFEPLKPPAGALELGTALKIALAGLVVVSVILLLKSKP